MPSDTPLQILSLQLEFPAWYRTLKLSFSPENHAFGHASAWAYTSGLGIEEGFAGNNVHCLTLTTPFWGKAQQLCRNRHLDQVWMEVVRHEHVSADFLKWVQGAAPVRVGMIQESLNQIASASRLAAVFQRLNHCTHVLVGDEADVDFIRSRTTIPVLWCPTFIPRRFINESVTACNGGAYATFNGNVYGARAAFTAAEALRGLLRCVRSPERFTPYPYAFSTLHVALWLYTRCRLPVGHGLLNMYMRALRLLRLRCCHLWMNSLRQGSAIVNLPSVFGGYPSRVLEAMAVSQPVLTWKPENRPRLAALFEHGTDILCYSGPEELAKEIRTILDQPSLRQTLVDNARRKILTFHTAENRVQQVLTWIKTGTEPVFT